MIIAATHSNTAPTAGSKWIDTLVILSSELKLSALHQVATAHRIGPTLQHPQQAKHTSDESRGPPPSTHAKTKVASKNGPDVIPPTHTIIVLPTPIPAVNRQFLTGLPSSPETRNIQQIHDVAKVHEKVLPTEPAVLDDTHHEQLRQTREQTNESHHQHGQALFLHSPQKHVPQHHVNMELHRTGTTTAKYAAAERWGTRIATDHTPSITATAANTPI
jgi:hypothetical protein